MSGFRVRLDIGVRARDRVRVRVRCFVVMGGHKGVLCVQQHCGSRR